MVDFSDRDDVKRWLDAIEPERRRREVAVAMAARAALRVLPLLSREVAENRDPGVALVAAVLPGFRAVALAWFVGKFPIHRADLRTATSAAAASVLTAAHTFAAATDAATAAHAAAVAAGNDAAAPAATADAVFAAISASDAAPFNYRASADASDNAKFAAADDAELIDSGRSGAKLAGSPLWPGGAPHWASDAWGELKRVLLAANQGWDVWTDWYEARLSGDAAHPPNEGLETARAMIPSDRWQLGPAVVNAEIKRLIDKFDPPKDKPPKRLGGSAADFSDRMDVKRWLDRIKPARRRREVAVAMAARAALRVAPLLVKELPRGRRRGEILSTIVLPSLRANALSWAAGKYPTRDDEIRTAAGTFSANVVFAAAAAEFTADAANSAAKAAGAVAFAADAGANAAAFAVFAADEVPAAGANAAATAYAADAALIDSGRSGVELAGMPLWPNGAPDWASEAWRTLRSALLAAGQDWEVWTDWYEARLAGDAARPPIEALEVARAMIPDEIWKKGPAVVNGEIRRLIEEHRSLQQHPAAFQFRVVDDKLDSLPDDARPIDAQDARDLYDEAKRKGRQLKDRLQRAQADENIRIHVDLLLARLGSSYADMRLGLMLSVLRSLESDARAYDGEEGRKELSAALLSNVLDVAESVRDLCAIFPRSREIEAEAVSLGLPMERLPDIRKAIDSVIAKVNHSDGATEGGRDAINASAANLAHQRGLAQEAKQSAYFLVDFANFTRAGLKHLKATGRMVGGELGGLGADGWRAIRRGAPKGIERGAAHAGKALVVGGVAALMHWLGSDIAALGSMVAPYVPLHEILQKMTGAPPDAQAPEPGADATPSETAEEAPAPRATKPRKPKARKPGKV